MASFFSQPRPAILYMIIVFLIGFIALDKLLDSHRSSDVVCPPCDNVSPNADNSSPGVAKEALDTDANRHIVNNNAAPAVENTGRAQGEVVPASNQRGPPQKKPPRKPVPQNQIRKMTQEVAEVRRPAEPERPAPHRCTTCNVYDLSQPNDFDFTCIQMRFTPSSPICLYPVKQDIYVSGSLAAYGTWEADMVHTFQGWLRQYPDSGVIDVGANLGVYSLVAAAMGRHVVSVEPNIENIHRYHLAIKKGNLQDRITLLQNAISDNAGIAKIVYSHNNQGDTQMRKQSDNANAPQFEDERRYTKMIVMDDLAQYCDFPKAIMKIDIQGFEHRAFAQAEILFDKVVIPKVMMEWDMMKPIYQKKSFNPEEYTLVEKMLKFFADRKYTPKDWGGRVMDLEIWQTWPFDIIWHKDMSSVG